MRVHQACGDMKALLRDAYHADPAIVVWNVLEQPLDCVVGVRALVDVFVALFVWMIWARLQELTFRHVTPARVLIDEYETLFLEVLGGTKRGPIVIHTIRRDAVGRARQEKWILLRSVFWNINGRVEPGSIAHRNLILVFCITLLHARRVLS